jgi:membrane-associated protease RseP (regulator of RpoE activity)
MLPEEPVKSSVADWASLFVVQQVARLRDEEVVHGLLRSGMDARDPAVRAALAAWEGSHFVRATPLGTEITLVRRVGPRPRERWWLHALLLALTALATSITGALLLGRAPLVPVTSPGDLFGIPIPVRVDPAAIAAGTVFSIPLLGILLGHELGHYVVARRRGMDVSPPYFIPSPHWLNLIGTFGAFIRLRSPMINRVMLLDVGAAGPIASFVLSFPVALLGLAWSHAVPAAGAPTSAPFLVLFEGQPIGLGGSLLFDALARVVLGAGGDTVVLLHPLAFAAWIGFFVTALNLFPLAQLDGGHILYALLGARQRWVGAAFLALLVALGFLWWGWWLWAGVVLLIGRGNVRHPTVYDPSFPVTGARRVVGWLCVAAFALTFVAIPIRL